MAIRDGQLIGYNTDMSGFRESFAAGLPGADLTHVLQIGAGVAGSAVAAALLELGVTRLEISDLVAKAEELAAWLAFDRPEASVVARSTGELGQIGYSGIVNASPVGMAKIPGTPLPTAMLGSAQWVADIVYFPLETELLRAARAVGCRTLDGSGMVICQAALAFEVITGRRADAVRMRQSFAAPAA